MKITIDTKEDSHIEIRKIIKMLSSLVGEEVATNQGDTFSDDKAQEAGSDMFNMFSADEQPKEDSEKNAESENIGIDIPKVEEYD
jgi:hypothetical protein